MTRLVAEGKSTDYSPRAMPMLTAPRFSFEPPGPESNSPRRVRAAWISDVHLGTRGANAGALLDFLREYEFETLYVVGDLIDIWQLRRGIYWPQQHNDVVQKILRKSRKARASFISPGITTICSVNFTALMATSPCRNMPFIVWLMDDACL
jgi:hypothetical protein